MNDQESRQAATALPGGNPLPYEPGSSAEVLSATRIFTVEVLQVSPGAWAREPGGLEHRQLLMKLRLLEALKGPLRIPPGSVFDLDVPQNREGGSIVADAPGFWSHAKVSSGQSYLVMSQGGGNNPAELMQDPAIAEFLTAAVAGDVKEAAAAEAQFGSLLRETADSSNPRRSGRRSAALDLLNFTYARRQTPRGFFGQYLWARIQPVYTQFEADLAPAALRIVEAEDTNLELRAALLYPIYDMVLALGRPQRITAFLRAALALLLQPSAKPLWDRLIQVPIYNLAVAGTERLSAEEVVPSAAGRARIAQVLAGFPFQRAAEVRNWLEGK